eukprot:GHVP01071097.1.p1 GENE.GHVP01071097.1~~GHVP01071097.1.p1  ORF type:complete len:115 (+),score=24.30 GHVP01071097.1:34-378(+)
MSSKISTEVMNEAIAKILDGSETKKRNFLETIDLFVGLKGYDPQKDKRFNGTAKLPYIPRESFKVCILGDETHCDKAKEIGEDFMTVEDLKKLQKNKKLIKKLAKKFYYVRHPY